MELRYEVPPWFLDSIQTADELKNVRAKVRLTDQTAHDQQQPNAAIKSPGEKPMSESAGDEQNTVFTVSQESVDELLDAAASLQITDLAGRLSASHSSLEISCGMRFGLQFLDELVILIAQELDSSLISINSQDLEDIGLDFYYQDKSFELKTRLNLAQTDDKSPSISYTDDDDDSDDNFDISHVAQQALQRYFGIRMGPASEAQTIRSNRALSAILDAMKNKGKGMAEKHKQDQEDLGSSFTPPGFTHDLLSEPASTILFFRDGLKSLAPSNSLTNPAAHNPLSGCLVEDAVTHRRKAGEKIIMIIAATHTDADEYGIIPHPETPWKISTQCQCHRPLDMEGVESCYAYYGPIWRFQPTAKTTVMPIDVSKGWPDETKFEWEGSVAVTRIQSFKRRLKAQLSQLPSTPPDLLEPHYNWLSLLPERAISHFSSVFFNSSVQIAFKRLLSRSFRKRKVDAGDVQAAFLRIAGSLSPAEKKVDDPSLTSVVPPSRICDGFDEEGIYTNCEQSPEDDSLSQKTDVSWSNRLRKLRDECDEEEEHLLSSLVDPAALDVQFDDVVLDKDMMASIKAVMQLSTLDAGSASSVIIRLANIKGALLYGPPGTGKTLLARAVAKNTESNMLVIDPALVNSPIPGMTEKLIRAVFTLAKKLYPCIVFLDEADKLLHRRDGYGGSFAAITQFLQSMDGLVPDTNAPFVLAATNRPMDLDSAILRRLPFKAYCRLPDAQARTKILLLLLKSVNRDLIDIDQLVAATDGFSGADLKVLCSQATLDWAIQQNVGMDQVGSEAEAPLTDVHFGTALKKIKPGNSRKDLAALDEFTKRYGPTTWSGASQLHLELEENGHYKVTDAWANYPPDAQKVMRWIDSQEPEESESPYYWEKKHLSLLVNPQTIETCWSDLAIDRKMEQEIRETISHHHDSCKSTKPYGLLGRAGIGGALVYGPPGTGKTQLARVLAHESGTVVLCATPADLMSKWYGEGPKAIQGLFNLAKLLSPSIIFIDEAEALFPARKHFQYQHEFAELNQLLHEMDGLSKSNKTPFILIATNMPGRLDPAVLRRVPSMFYFGLPSMEIRSKIFAAILKEEILHPGVDMYQLALVTPGLSGSDIRALCVQVAIICDVFVENGENEGKRLLTMSMFVEALNRITRTATKEALSSIRAFSKENHPIGLEHMQECDAENLRIKKASAKGTANSSKNQHQEWRLHTADTVRNYAPNTWPGIPTPGKVLSDEDAISDEDASQSQTTNDPNKKEPYFRFSCEDHSNSSAALLMINPPAGCVGKTRQRFSYTPLPTPTSIRLLKLYNLPGPGPWLLSDHPIRCSIVVADLADFPEYFALSYTWGDPRTIYTDKNDIFSAEAWAAPAFELDCDGHAVSVATNLYTALAAIRGGLSRDAFVSNLDEECYRSNNAEYSYIWVDALCINQDDLKEKSNQIPLMDRIYSQARATMMWLGGGELIINQGFSKTITGIQLVLDRIREELGLENEELVLERCRSFNIRSREAFENLGLEPIDPIDLIGFYLVFSRSWFKRAWIVQEWVLSTNCVFICGNLIIPQVSFSAALRELLNRHWIAPIQDLVKSNILDPKTMAMPTGEHERYMHQRELKLTKQSDVLPLFRAKLDYGVHEDLDQSHIVATLLRICFLNDRMSKSGRNNARLSKIFEDRMRPKLWMQFFRERRCSDPRDKVYAILGIFKKIDEKSVLPFPDYHKPVREVYIEAARAFAADIGLSLLQFREFRSSNHYRLPSWVPNFQSGSGILYFDDPYTEASFYMAAAGMKATTLTFKDHERLGLAGCYVDTVVRPEPFHFQLGNTGSTFRHLRETLRHIPEESLIAMPPSNVQEYQSHGFDDAIGSTTTKQGRFEVLWRTLCQDKMRECHPASTEGGGVLRRRLGIILALQYHYIVMNETIQLCGHLDTTKLGQNSSASFFSQWEIIYERTLRRMFFVLGATDVKYDSQEQTDAFFDINAVIEMLDGNLSMDSEERPPPKAWVRHQVLWENARAALKARDYAAIKECLRKANENMSFFPIPEAEWSNADKFLGTRMLFATSGGRLGLIAGGIERGDEIWILPGSNTPVALRRVGDGLYSLVGAVYVHGIMHGEGVPDSKEVVDFDLI